MEVFDESKVINALHRDRAEVGKKYYFADYLGILKERVESNDSGYVYELTYVDDNDNCCFRIDGSLYALLYLYEEPPKQRMTYRQLAEWLAKGNGEYVESKDINKYCIPMYSMTYTEGNRDEPVKQGIFIRTWDSDEWVEPTLDIYERDCKGGKE